jgi:hypothetical protein
MTGANIDNQWVWSRRQARQRPSKSLVHSLSHPMFDHSPVQIGIQSNHINERNIPINGKFVNINLAKVSKMLQK